MAQIGVGLGGRPCVHVCVGVRACIYVIQVHVHMCWCMYMCTRGYTHKKKQELFPEGRPLAVQASPAG